MTDYCHCLKMSGPCQVSSPLKHSWELGTTTHMSSSFYMSILLLKLSQHLRYLGLFLSNLHQTKWECCDIDILIEMKDVKTCFISNCKRVTGSLIIHYILTVNVNILFEISLDDNIVYLVYSLGSWAWYSIGVCLACVYIINETLMISSNARSLDTPTIHSGKNSNWFIVRTYKTVHSYYKFGCIFCYALIPCLKMLKTKTKECYLKGYVNPAWNVLLS